jgi:hypothetical protein
VVVEAYIRTFKSYLSMDWVKHHIGRRETRLRRLLCRVTREEIHLQGKGKFPRLYRRLLRKATVARRIPSKLPHSTSEQIKSVTSRLNSNPHHFSEPNETKHKCLIKHYTFFFLWLYSPIEASAASMKLSVSLQLLDLGQSVGFLGRVINSSQGLYLYTNTEKRTHNTNTKQQCPEWDSNPRSPRPRERKHFMT